MFNLLPDSLKEKIKSEYKLRRLILILVMVIFVQVSCLIFLSPSWLVSLYKEKEVLIQTEDVNKSQLASSTNSVVSVIKSTNKKLTIINTVLEYPKITPALNIILSKKTTSIHITDFSYTFSTGKTAVISLGGISGTREALVAFVKSLQDTGAFKGVDLPVSNLAKDKDITFNINMVVPL